MHTVLLRLSAPLQSWGTTSQWEERATTVRPTKSGVVGIVANALGYDRDDELSALAPLLFAVRADRPGHIDTDLQSAGGGQPALANPLSLPAAYGAPRGPEPDPAGTLHAAEGATSRTTVLVVKHYVADAAFLAGLSTPDKDLADEIAAALARPARPLYLGRRSCPPSHPIYHGTTSLDAWPDRIPLLPEASDFSPWAWTESPPGPATFASPEQVPTTFEHRDHPLMHLHRRRTLPAAPQPPGGAA